MGRQRRVRGAAVETLFPQREHRGGAVLDLRPAGAGSARHLARRQLAFLFPLRTCGESIAGAKCGRARGVSSNSDSGKRPTPDFLAWLGSRPSPRTRGEGTETPILGL